MLFEDITDCYYTYGAFPSYPGLYILGRATEGADQIGSLSGTVHAEALPVRQGET